MALAPCWPTSWPFHPWPVVGLLAPHFTIHIDYITSWIISFPSLRSYTTHCAHQRHCSLPLGHTEESALREASRGRADGLPRRHALRRSGTLFAYQERCRAACCQNRSSAVSKRAEKKEGGGEKEIFFQFQLYISFFPIASLLVSLPLWMALSYHLAPMPCPALPCPWAQLLLGKFNYKSIAIYSSVIWYGQYGLFPV